MSLFEVPGWSVPSAPVVNSVHSRKRKRPAGDGMDKVHSAEVNIEKLMKKLDKVEGSAPEGDSRKRNMKAQSHVKKVGTAQAAGGKGKQKVTCAVEERPGPTDVEGGPSTLSKRKRKKGKKEGNTAAPPSAPSQSTTPSKKALPSQIQTTGLTALQNDMKQSLDGARFRWINEVLYKSDSARAHEMMREDRNIFDEYHKGFRHQVQSWPSNPVSHYISTLSSYPPKTVIADLGCGDAALARALVPKGLTVMSFDLVSDGAFVIEADIFGRLPLPGSEHGEEKEMGPGEKAECDGQVVDVVVCALSLMGINWPNCIREAWRVLRHGGELKIAEVASRFTDVGEFTSLVSSFGFKLKSSDDHNTHFTLFEFQKIGRKAKSDKEWERLLSNGSILKPCEYKRR